MPMAPITLTDAQVAEIETLAALLNQEQIADYLGVSRRTFGRPGSRSPTSKMDLMARYIAELGLTPSARRRVMPEGIEANEPLIIFKTIYEWEGKEIDAAPDGRRPMIRLLPGAENA